ncbi:MAG: sigma-54-dependent Fis family transcriptional regulator [Bacteroidetes bacterium]|nr:sigma-54-dependent Fis family transcriptional regulator [Bacteroidota bacterium]
MSVERTIHILLIEDEEFDVRRVRNTVKPFANTFKIVDIISNGRVALEVIQNKKDFYDVVIMDFQIAGGLMGENLIREIKRIDATLQIIVITKMTMNLADYDFANRLIQAGAFWYCTKYPGDIEEYIYQPTDFVLSIINAYQKRILEKERTQSDSKLLRSIEDRLAEKNIIGNSPAMVNLRFQIDKCAEHDATVLITGSSGTGKELVAMNIHLRSKRRMENFVPINCGSIPNTLLESELFGYEKGAFTGAQNAKRGLFELANGGTIFLDEIAELPATAQVKLLRVIQEGEIEKIGRREPIRVNVRVIAATNKNLEEEIESKNFREDLYYRLNVVPVYIMPLRERNEDIPLLVEHFLHVFSIDMGKPKPQITKEAMSVLQFAPWKGNIRELKNVMQRFYFFDVDLVTPEIVKSALGLTSHDLQARTPEFINFTALEKFLPLRDVEKFLRKKYVEYVRSSVSSDAEAAKILGLAPSNYHRLCKDVGIK